MSFPAIKVNMSLRSMFRMRMMASTSFMILAILFVSVGRVCGLILLQTLQMKAAPKEVGHLKKAITSMPLRKIGSSDLILSQVGIGSSMFGLKTDEIESHRLLDIAFDEYGVNYIETSESYPRPNMPETFGKAHEIIGSWLKNRDRSSVIIASQVCGRSNYMDWLRKDGVCTAVTPSQINESVDMSLKRLGTDYIDLLQIEWPDRYVPEIGDDYFNYEKDYEPESFMSQLEAMQGLIKAGKVRHIGVSNETPYGVMKFAELAKWNNLPMIASVQNGYNLLHRHGLELGLIEACAPRNWNIGIIAHTPLGGGALTGKYIDQTIFAFDENARLNKFHGYQIRYINENSKEAVRDYAKLCEKFNLSLTDASLQWVFSRPHIASTVICATSEEQLRQNLGAMNAVIPKEMHEEIYRVFCTFREPTLGPIIA